ncbi:hypothetical protein CHS0354_042546, partial [Potamilus streckersoni]
MGVLPKRITGAMLGGYLGGRKSSNGPVTSKATAEIETLTQLHQDSEENEQNSDNGVEEVENEGDGTEDEETNELEQYYERFGLQKTLTSNKK